MNGREIIIGALLLFAASEGHAQDAPVPVRHLSIAEAELAHPFTRLAGIRELSDGRLIVVDQGEKLVAGADFARNTLTRIGRDGAGPGEYTLPHVVLAALGDTTIVGDLTRLTKLDPGGRYAGEVRIPETTRGNAAPRVRLVGRMLADGQGRLYRQGRQRDAGRRRANCEADSVAIERVDLRSAKLDTVAWFPVIPESVYGLGDGGGVASCGVRSGPYVAFPTWVVTPDGRIASVSPEPYRVAWFSTAGTRTVAPPIAFQRVPVTNAEKQAYRDGYASNPTVGMIASGNRPGPATASYLTIPFQEPAAWTPQKSPFEHSPHAVLASPTGEIWIRKQLPHTEKQPMYDIIGPRGELVERVVIPERSFVVGFGRNGVVYIVRKDEDDVQHLQRFRIR